MKQTLRNQLTNIVFVVLIVAAALAIYLLSRSGSGAVTPTTTPGATETATPTPPEADTQKSSTRGVPESVFTTYLATNEVFSADKSRRDSREYTLTYGDSPSMEANLRYEVLEGNLSSIEIVFPLLEEYKSKAKTDIEKYLYKTAQEQQLALQDTLFAILSDLLPACDAKDELQLSSIRYWVEQSMLLKKVGSDFEDTLEGYHFLAYRSQGDVQQELICVFYLT